MILTIKTREGHKPDIFKYDDLEEYNEKGPHDEKHIVLHIEDGRAVRTDNYVPWDERYTGDGLPVRHTVGATALPLVDRELERKALRTQYDGGFISREQFMKQWPATFDPPLADTPPSDIEETLILPAVLEKLPPRVKELIYNLGSGGQIVFDEPTSTYAITGAHKIQPLKKEAVHDFFAYGGLQCLNVYRAVEGDSLSITYTRLGHALSCETSGHYNREDFATPLPGRIPRPICVAVADTDMSEHYPSFIGGPNDPHMRGAPLADTPSRILDTLSAEDKAAIYLIGPGSGSILCNNGALYLRADRGEAPGEVHRITIQRIDAGQPTEKEFYPREEFAPPVDKTDGQVPPYSYEDTPKGIRRRGGK